MEVSKPRLGLAGLMGEGRFRSCRTNAGSTETCSISTLNSNFPRVLRDILSFSCSRDWNVLTSGGQGAIQTARSHSVFWAPISSTAITGHLGSSSSHHAKKTELTTNAGYFAFSGSLCSLLHCPTVILVLPGQVSVEAGLCSHYFRLVNLW